MCDAVATTKEHVPPKCLFPEEKDVGENLRKDLITVPSCREHNNKKSGEDAFLMVSLAGIIGSNSIGYRHKFTKVDRALRRESYRQLNEVFEKKEFFKVRLEENKFIEVIHGTSDQTRISRIFDQICRGLSFHLTGKKFKGRTKALLGFTHIDQANPREFQKMIRNRVEEELTDLPFSGTNPDVFAFRRTEPDEFGVWMFDLRFYGGLDIYVAMVPDGSDPRDFTMELIHAGIHTVVNHGGVEYEFNGDPIVRGKA